MSFEKVTPGKNAPETFNVVIEIAANSDPVKYEVDKETGCVFVDRFMGTAMHYPCNYGYVPQTLAGDGDPVDVLVLTPFPLPSGVVVPCHAMIRRRCLGSRQRHRPGTGHANVGRRSPDAL